MVRACGPRIRSLWRFLRVGRRPAGAAKPADVNSLVCEDEEECFLTVEYRVSNHYKYRIRITCGYEFKNSISVVKELAPIHMQYCQVPT